VYAMQLTKYDSFFKKHPYFLTCAVARAKYKTEKALYDTSLKVIKKTSYGTAVALQGVLAFLERPLRPLLVYSSREPLDTRLNDEQPKKTLLKKVAEMPKKVIRDMIFFTAMGISCACTPLSISYHVARAAYIFAGGNRLDLD